MMFENRPAFRTPFFAIFGGFSPFLGGPGGPGFGPNRSQRGLGSEFAFKNCGPARLVGPSWAPETEFGTEPCASSLFCMIFSRISTFFGCFFCVCSVRASFFFPIFLPFLKTAKLHFDTPLSRILCFRTISSRQRVCMQA